MSVLLLTRAHSRRYGCRSWFAAMASMSAERVVRRGQAVRELAGVDAAKRPAAVIGRRGAGPAARGRLGERAWSGHARDGRVAGWRSRCHRSGSERSRRALRAAVRMRRSTRSARRDAGASATACPARRCCAACASMSRCPCRASWLARYEYTCLTSLLGHGLFVMDRGRDGPSGPGDHFCGQQTDIPGAGRPWPGLARATAKIGASVDSGPPVRPVIAGCDRYSRNDRSSR